MKVKTNEDVNERMSDNLGRTRANSVRHMFSRIAGRYDITNRVMTWGQDVRWRNEVLDRAGLPTADKVLDIGAGTGDLALGARARERGLQVVGADFTAEMMQIGRQRAEGGSILWVNADALALPFKAESFDAVVSAYLLRNVVDIDVALGEQYRVLRRGGRMVCLDTTPLPEDAWHIPARLYVRYIIPVIGWIVAGNGAAYRYLPESTERFLRAEDLARGMESAGFREVGFRRFMGGAMATHWGVK